MIKNYISKILLAAPFARNYRTIISILLNSKKYSNKRKDKSLISRDLNSEKYNLKMFQKKFDILMRTYKGDISIFYEIFWNKSYLIPNDFLKRPKTIVDLGAHVGFTSIFYSLLYPESKIYAVEASKQNFKLLEFNVSKFENIISFNNAIFPTDGEIFFDESGPSYNSKISDTGQPIKTQSISTLMKKHKIQKIDLMKIDIEGAEIQLLRENNDWLHQTENIIIELHKPYAVSDLRKDLEPFGFEIIVPNHANGLKNILAKKQ